MHSGGRRDGVLGPEVSWTVGAEDTILIHAAAGGVGSAAVQIAQDLRGPGDRHGLRGAIRSTSAELGAEPVTYGPGLAEVRLLTDEAGSVTAVLDTVGSDDSVAATAELLQGGTAPR